MTRILMNLMALTFALTIIVPASAAPPTGGTPLPAHCTNGVQDGDETDIDCGGSCAACGTAPIVPATVVAVAIPAPGTAGSKISTTGTFEPTIHTECPRNATLNEEDPANVFCECNEGYEPEEYATDESGAETAVKCSPDRLTRMGWAAAGRTDALRDELFGLEDDEEDTGVLGKLEDQLASHEEWIHGDPDNPHDNGAEGRIGGLEDWVYGDHDTPGANRRLAETEQGQRRIEYWIEGGSRIDGRIAIGDHRGADDEPGAAKRLENVEDGVDELTRDGGTIDQIEDDIDDVEGDVKVLQDEVEVLKARPQPVFLATVGGGILLHRAPRGDFGDGVTVPLSLPAAPMLAVGGAGGFLQEIVRNKGARNERTFTHGFLADIALQFALSTHFDAEAGELSDKGGTSVGLRVSGGYYRVLPNNFRGFVGLMGEGRMLDYRLLGYGYGNQVDVGPTVHVVIPFGSSNLGLRLRADVGILGFLAVDPSDPEVSSTYWAPQISGSAELVLGKF